MPDLNKRILLILEIGCLCNRATVRKKNAMEIETKDSMQKNCEANVKHPGVTYTILQ